MPRVRYNLLTLLSLLLCVAVVAQCARSYFSTDTLKIEGPRGTARVVFDQGDAVVGIRGEDAGNWEASFAFGTGDLPRDPDYFPDGSEWYGPPRAAEPPGQGWKAVPYDTFVTVPLWVVTMALGVLPARRLVIAMRRGRRGGARPESAIVPIARRRRLLRAAVATSIAALVLALAGWVDSATWHYQSVKVGRDRYVHLTSMWGECELLLLVNWRRHATTGLIRDSPWEMRHRPTLVWLREAWLAPEYRGHHTPERLQLFTWFSCVLDTDSGHRFLEPFARDPDPGSTGLFGTQAAPDRNSPITGFTVEIPYWFVVLLAGALPGVAALRTLRRHRRQEDGLCRDCGYDLRASKGRCPECGSTATGVI